MKKRNLIAPMILTLAAAPSYAGNAYGHYKDKHMDRDDRVVKARVSHVEPIVEVVQIPQERRECWDEEVSGTTTRHSNGGMVAGAIIGGVIGHNIGDRHNRRATTAIGSMIGAAVGHDADHSYQQPYSYTEQHCSVTTDYIEEEHILGYRVSYTFQGEQYSTRMDHDPGRFVHLRVSHQLLD